MARANKTSVSSAPWELVSQDAVLWKSLHQLMKATNEAMPASAKRLEMSRTDMAILEMVMNNPCSPSELAKHLKITPAAVTIAVNRLEEKGHLLRLQDPEDARKVLITMTPSAIAEVSQELSGMFQDIHSVIANVDGQQRAVISDFLQNVTQVLQKHSDR